MREANEGDAGALAAIFVSAIRAAGAAPYTPSQLDAWMEGAKDPLSFARRVLAHPTLLATQADRALGFVSVAHDGYIDMLYVRGEAQGGGLGSRLLQEAIERATASGAHRVYAAASAFSVPVFERAGFRRVGVEQVEVRGEQFERALVEKRLESIA